MLPASTLLCGYGSHGSAALLENALEVRIAEPAEMCADRKILIRGTVFARLHLLFLPGEKVCARKSTNEEEKADQFKNRVTQVSQVHHECLRINAADLEARAGSRGRLRPRQENLPG
jgi:hypothetical protein